MESETAPYSFFIKCAMQPLRSWAVTCGELLLIITYLNSFYFMFDNSKSYKVW